MVPPVVPQNIKDLPRSVDLAGFQGHDFVPGLTIKEAHDPSCSYIVWGGLEFKVDLSFLDKFFGLVVITRKAP